MKPKRKENRGSTDISIRLVTLLANILSDKFVAGENVSRWRHLPSKQTHLRQVCPTPWRDPGDTSLMSWTSQPTVICTTEVTMISHAFNLHNLLFKFFKFAQMIKTFTKSLPNYWLSSPHKFKTSNFVLSDHWSLWITKPELRVMSDTDCHKSYYCNYNNYCHPSHLVILNTTNSLLLHIHISPQIFLSLSICEDLSVLCFLLIRKINYFDVICEM